MMQPNNLHIREVMIRLLDISENDYNNRVISGADEYLHRTLRPEDNEALMAMRKSSYFWKWWLTQWDRRNKILLHDLGYTQSTILVREERMQLRSSFEHTHSINNLNVYPNRIVMENTYAIMIGELHDEIHKEKGQRA